MKDNHLLPLALTLLVMKPILYQVEDISPEVITISNDLLHAIVTESNKIKEHTVGQFLSS